MLFVIWKDKRGEQGLATLADSDIKQALAFSQEKIAEGYHVTLVRGKAIPLPNQEERR